MDEDALMAIGAVLAVLSGLLERSRLCTRTELANMLGNMAVATEMSAQSLGGRQPTSVPGPTCCTRARRTPPQAMKACRTSVGISTNCRAITEH
jgi:hypothetical protein